MYDTIILMHTTIGANVKRNGTQTRYVCGLAGMGVCFGGGRRGRWCVAGSLNKALKLFVIVCNLYKEGLRFLVHLSSAKAGILWPWRYYWLRIFSSVFVLLFPLVRSIQGFAFANNGITLMAGTRESE